MVWVWELSTGVFIFKRVVLMMLSLFINFPMSLCIKAKVYLIRWIAANFRAVVRAAHATEPPREDKITIFRKWKKASPLSRSGTKQPSSSRGVSRAPSWLQIWHLPLLISPQLLSPRWPRETMSCVSACPSPFLPEVGSPAQNCRQRLGAPCERSAKQAEWRAEGSVPSKSGMEMNRDEWGGKGGKSKRQSEQQ